MKKLTASLILLVLALPLRAASSGRTGADFLQIPAGARPAALGGTYAAVGTDAYSPVWNPAGIALIPQSQIALQHLTYIDSSRYEFGSFVLPIFEKSAVAISARDFASGSIAGTDGTGNSTSDFSVHSGAYSLSYGQAITSALSLGITGSMISTKLENVSASAISFDAGALYRPTEKLSLALVGVNFGNQMTFLKEKDSLPAGVKLEGAYKPMNGLTVTAGGTFRLQGPASARAGVEYQPFHGFMLRAGYKTEGSAQLSGIAGLTAGAGFEILGQEISYAWVPFGDLGDTHYISVVFKFGSKHDEEKHVAAPLKTYPAKATVVAPAKTETPKAAVTVAPAKKTVKQATAPAKKRTGDKTALKFSSGYRP